MCSLVRDDGDTEPSIARIIELSDLGHADSELVREPILERTHDAALVLERTRVDDDEVKPEDTDEHGKGRAVEVVLGESSGGSSQDAPFRPRDASAARAECALHPATKAASKVYHVLRRTLGRLETQPMRQRLGWGALSVFALQFPALQSIVDVPGSVSSEGRVGLAWIASLAFAGLAATCARRRAPRALLAFVFGVVLFAQALSVGVYHAPLDLQIARAARAAWPDVRVVLSSSAPLLALGALVTSALEWFLLSAASAARFRYDRLLFGGGFLVSIAFGPELDHAGPELRFASALRVLTERSPARIGGAPALPILPSSRATVPSILLLITESVRASDYASSSEVEPETNPEIAALLPQRVGLSEMRAVSSYTTISIAALTTGRPQLGSREEIARAPNLFDIGKSVRVRGEPLRVAYYSDQSVTGVFEREDIHASCDRFVGLEDLQDSCEKEGPSEQCTRASLDARIVDLFEREMIHTPSPALVVLHLYNTHVPYAFDDASAKFKPFSRSVSWEGTTELHNAYKNAIVAQDRQLARAVRAFIASRGASPTVILMTSDHGEAFGEHHAIHHGQNLYDEQIHVPAFVAGSPGALDDEAQRALKGRAEGPTSHYDVLPTILDILGVWESPAFSAYRGPMLGSSLLGTKVGSRAVPMTSCNASSRCPLNTWGMLGDEHALVAQAWDAHWNCVRLDDRGSQDPEAPECERLRATSKAYFSTLPGGEVNR